MQLTNKCEKCSIVTEFTSVSIGVNNKLMLTQKSVNIIFLLKIETLALQRLCRLLLYFLDCKAHVQTLYTNSY